MEEAEILARFAAFEQRIAELEAEVEQHRRAGGTGHPSGSPIEPGGTPAPPAPDVVAAPRHLSRRGVIGAGAAAAAAGAAGLVAGAPSAAATDGGNLVLGTYTNTSAGATAIVLTGHPGYGFGSIDTSYPGTFTIYQPALFGYAAGSASNVGGMFSSSADQAYGAVASSSGTYGTGLVAAAGGDNGTGLLATSQSATGTGAVVAGDHVALQLAPFSLVRTAPTGDSVPHQQGDLVEDSSGNLWLCTQAGTPGTWRKLAGPDTAGALHVLPVPVRVYDSRAGAPPHVAPQTPLAANTARRLDLKVNGSGVPAGASAVLLTCMVVNATAGSGNLTVWANGHSRPASNTLVWGGTSGRASTQAISAVDASAKVLVQASIQTDLVLDVVGYHL